MEQSPGVDVDDPVIRPAIAEDADAIGQLWAELVSYHRRLDGRLPLAAENGAERYARRVVDRLDDDYTRVLVAENEAGSIVGFAVGVVIDLVPEMFAPESGGFVADIFVAETYRRSGVGRQLVDALADWFRSRGLEHMEWYVAAQNQAGREFWASLGGRDVMVRMRIEL
jgi:ribosomal protein S18 acetylase RimI-like enzyme